MWKFICSRFYRWSKIVVWVIALIRIGLSQTLTGAIITLALALGYSIIPPLIGRVCDTKDMYSYNHPSRSKIEEYKETSPAMQNLSTLLQDVSNINKLNSGSGIQFSHLNININAKLAPAATLGSKKASLRTRQQKAPAAGKQQKTHAYFAKNNKHYQRHQTSRRLSF